MQYETYTTAVPRIRVWSLLNTSIVFSTTVRYLVGGQPVGSAICHSESILVVNGAGDVPRWVTLLRQIAS